ncbi:uncharacterized protein TNCV_2724791 [Trichonephila clavipes]|nr:uncharacterized protein TNCV_2724791 [Trichonephila clavipes]
MTWTTPELAPALLTTTQHQREDVSALDSFNVHRCPTRRVFSGTGFEPVTKQATVRYLYHSATAATLCLGNKTGGVEPGGSNNLTIGHEERDRFLKELSAKYKNIACYDIELYIHLYEPFQ